jgi:hypothetical protein
MRRRLLMVIVCSRCVQTREVLTGLAHRLTSLLSTSLSLGAGIKGQQVRTAWAAVPADSGMSSYCKSCKGTCMDVLLARC